MLITLLKKKKKVFFTWKLICGFSYVRKLGFTDANRLFWGKGTEEEVLESKCEGKGHNTTDLFFLFSRLEMHVFLK